MPETNLDDLKDFFMQSRSNAVWPRSFEDEDIIKQNKEDAEDRSRRAYIVSRKALSQLIAYVLTVLGLVIVAPALSSSAGERVQLFPGQGSALSQMLGVGLIILAIYYFHRHFSEQREREFAYLEQTVFNLAYRLMLQAKSDKK